MKKLIILILLVGQVFAWEVNTHQALTIKALEKNSENLKYFVEIFGFDKKSDDTNYYDQYFENYTFKNGNSPISYFDYASIGELWGISKEEFKIGFKKDLNHNYKALIQAGSILEDSLNPGINQYVTAPLLDMLEWLPDVDSGKGRFKEHFYDANNYGKKLSFVGNYSSTEWASGDNDNKNSYDYDDLLEYYKNAIVSETKEERKKYQAKLFVTTGFLLHLLQDMFVPAHTRDDNHAFKYPLEEFLRKDGGFNASNGKLNYSNDENITNAVNNSSSIKQNFSDFKDFYITSANFTGKKFMSKDTIFTYPPTEEEVTKDYDVLFPEYEKYYYLSQDSVVYPKKLALYTLNPYYDSDTKPSQQFQNEYENFVMYEIPYKLHPYDTDIDNSVLIENAKNLLPKAVGTSAKLIDYIYRGKIEAKLVDYFDNTKQLQINNISDYNFENGTLSIYYETEKTDEKRKPLDTCKKDNITINKNSFYFMDNYENIISEINGEDIPEDNNITLYIVFEGKIGEDEGVAVTKLEIVEKKRFVRNDEKEIVYDYQELKMWEDQVITHQDSYFGAIRYCNNLTLGGYTDWRLPSPSELRNIANYMDGDSFVYDEFKHLGEVGHWSYENIYIYPTIYVYGFSFGSGSYFILPYYYHMNVKCVRGLY